MTLTDDRLATSPLPSNLTTVPTWHPYAPRTRTSDPQLLSSRRASRGEVRVYIEGANLPWWFDEYLSQELNQLYALPAGWDGFSSDQITIEAIQAAVTTLVTIADETTPAPQFFPLRDGGIQVEWHVGGNDIEIEVNGVGVAYVFAARPDGEVIADGEVGAEEQERLLRALKTFLNELSRRLALAH